jgi:DNA ligase 1
MYSSDGKKKYIIKRNGNTLTCSCPGFRFVKKSLDQKTCKHLQAAFGDAFEEARIQANGQAQTDQKPKSKADGKAASQSAPRSKSTSNGKRKREKDDEGEKSLDVAKDDEGEYTSGRNANLADDPNDPLARIDGFSPKVVLADGEEKEISSQTRSS